MEKGVDPRSGKERKPTPEALKQISDAFPEVSYMDLLRKAGYIKISDTFGETIRELREERGWSLDELVANVIEKNESGEIIASISQERLNSFENGNIKNPSKGELFLLCKTINVPFHRFTTTTDIEVSLEDQIKLFAQDAAAILNISTFAKQELLNKATENEISNDEKVKIFDFIQQLDSARYTMAEKTLNLKRTLQDTGLIESTGSYTTQERKNDDNDNLDTEYIIRENELGNLLLFNENLNYKGQPLNTYQRRLLFEKVIEVMEQPEK